MGFFNLKSDLVIKIYTKYTASEEFQIPYFLSKPSKTQVQQENTKMVKEKESVSVFTISPGYISCRIPVLLALMLHRQSGPLFI